MHIPTKREFFQNPLGWLSGTWVVSSALSAILVPRAVLVVLLLFGLAILVNALARRQIPPLPERQIASMFASVFLLAALSVLWSVTPDETLQKIPRIGFLLLLGLLALATTQRVTPRMADQTMVLTTLVYTISLSVIAIEIYFDNIIYRTLISPVSQTAGPAAVNGNIVNQPALLIVLYLWPVCLALWLKGYRALSMVFLGAELAVFAFSNSQSVALALLAGTLATALTALFPRLMKTWLCLAIIGFMIALPEIPQFLQSLLHGYEDRIPASGLHRLEIWNFVISKILEHPVLGYGLESSRILGAGTQSIAVPDASLLPLHPHNGFLQIWLELGIAGYVISGVICLWILHKISLLNGPRMAFSAGLLVCGLSLFSTAYGMWQGWIIAVEFSAATALLISLKLPDNSQHTDG